MPTDTESTLINQQINDSLETLHNMLRDTNVENIRDYSHQIVAHAVGLAMLNAVNQQQQRYILRNAITTAAANAIIKSDPKEAIALAEESLVDDPIVDTLSQLKSFMDEINNTTQEIRSSSSKANASKSKPAAGPAKGKKVKPAK